MLIKASLMRQGEAVGELKQRDHDFSYTVS